MASKLRSALVAFEHYRIFGLSGEFMSMHPSLDAAWDWMHEYCPPPVGVRQRSKTQHVPLTQRHKPGSKAPVKDFVGRAGVQMPLQSATYQDGSEKTDQR
jgi:hypothetical protein